MTLIFEKIQKCKCGSEFKIEKYLSVNVTVHPELKNKVLKGEINCGKCPKCGRVYCLPIGFLYVDMKRSFQIEISSSLVGNGRLIKEVIKKMERKYTLQRGRHLEKERKKTLKRFEKEIGITLEEWHILPKKEIKKKLRNFYRKKGLSKKDLEKRLRKFNL